MRKSAEDILVEWSVSLIVGEVKVGTQITEHLKTEGEGECVGWHVRKTHPTQLLVSF
jgi:hypothetical protein